jgi:hypothetical protein
MRNKFSNPIIKCRIFKYGKWEPENMEIAVEAPKRAMFV